MSIIGLTDINLRYAADYYRVMLEMRNVSSAVAAVHYSAS
jgi:hypothetical protein